jgi:hypothetical protein
VTVSACGGNGGQTTTTSADVPPLRAQGADQVVVPVLWFMADKTSSEIAPADRGAWYAAYRTMLEHDASLAQRANAGLLVVGSELVSMSRDTDAWTDLVAAARNRFVGRLTYAANWVDEADQIGFWDTLDSVGIDAYMPLTPDDPNPSVQQLQAAWQPYVARMREVGERAGKPVPVTELGYTSRKGTALAPATEGDGPISQQAQANAYAGAFRALGHQSWISGLLIWDWSAEDRVGPGDYSPQGKHARLVMRRWFGGAAPSDATG